MNQLKTLSTSALAYLGDAVFELVVRQRCLFPPQRIHQYHQQVVSQVKAEAQASYVQGWISHLTEAELDIFRQGRNAAVGKPKRVTMATYQQATGFESLIGYLYLTDLQRLDYLLSLLPSLDLQSP